MYLHQIVKKIDLFHNNPAEKFSISLFPKLMNTLYIPTRYYIDLPISGGTRFAQILFLYDFRFTQSSLDQFNIKLAMIIIFEYHLALSKKHHENAKLFIFEKSFFRKSGTFNKFKI